MRFRKWQCLVIVAGPIIRQECERQVTSPGFHQEGVRIMQPGTTEGVGENGPATEFSPEEGNAFFLPIACTAIPETASTN
jgi:hypothetical protein